MDEYTLELQVQRYAELYRAAMEGIISDRLPEAIAHSSQSLQR
jgi:hypothetical protein